VTISQLLVPVVVGHQGDTGKRAYCNHLHTCTMTTSHLYVTMLTAITRCSV